MSGRVINTLFLAADGHPVIFDRKVLRRYGVVQAAFFRSGRQALAHLASLAAEPCLALAANGPASTVAPLVDLIVCNERLEDMSGIAFLARLRSVAAVAGVPAVLMVGDPESETARAARASGSCVVLARPYSPEQGLEAINAAARPEAMRAPMLLPRGFVDKPQPQARPHKTASRPVSKATPSRLPGENLLLQGLDALKQGDLELADRCLTASREQDSERVETCLALSRLRALEHKENEELVWLCRAALLCFKRGQASRAVTILSRLPRGRSGQAPLVAEAGLALQAGEIRAAALAFLEAHRLDPAQPLHALIGRSCMFTPAPEAHMRELLAALSRNGHDATASRLYLRLFQPSKVDAAPKPSIWDRFPRLGDIVQVAGYTLRLWRQT